MKPDSHSGINTNGLINLNSNTGWKQYIKRQWVVVKLIINYGVMGFFKLHR